MLTRWAIAGSSSHDLSLQVPSQLSTAANWCLSNSRASASRSSPSQATIPSPRSGQLSFRRMPITWLPILAAEVVKGVVARDAGDAGDEQRQRRIGQVRA